MHIETKHILIFLLKKKNKKHNVQAVHALLLGDLAVLVNRECPHYFLLLHNSPLYRYTTLYLSGPLLTDF